MAYDHRKLTSEISSATLKLYCDGWSCICYLIPPGGEGEGGKLIALGGPSDNAPAFAQRLHELADAIMGMVKH